MFNLIYVVLSMIYRKAVNFLVDARKTYPKFFKDIFDKIMSTSQFFFLISSIYTLRRRVCHIIGM